MPNLLMLKENSLGAFLVRGCGLFHASDRSISFLAEPRGGNLALAASATGTDGDVRIVGPSIA